MPPSPNLLPAMGLSSLYPPSTHIPTHQLPTLSPTFPPNTPFTLQQDPDTPEGDRNGGDHRQLLSTNETRWPSLSTHLWNAPKTACVLPSNNDRHDDPHDPDHDDHDGWPFDSPHSPCLHAYSLRNTKSRTTTTSEMFLNGVGAVGAMAKLTILRDVHSFGRSLDRCTDNTTTQPMYGLGHSDWFHADALDFAGETDTSLPLSPTTTTSSADDSQTYDGPGSYTYLYPFQSSQCMSPESSTTDTDTDEDSLAYSLSSLSSLASIADRDHDYHPSEGILFDNDASDHDHDHHSRPRIPTTHHSLDESCLYHLENTEYPFSPPSSTTTHSIPTWLDNLSPQEDYPEPLIDDHNDDVPSSPFARFASLPWDEQSDALAPLALPEWPQQEPPPDSPRHFSFLSLPGSDADDDLIPADLASKSYNSELYADPGSPPSPSPFSPPFSDDSSSSSSSSSSPWTWSDTAPGSPLLSPSSPSSSLLLFDSDVDGLLGNTSAARSPPPETLHLSPNLFLCDSNKAANQPLCGEAQKVYELRERLSRRAVGEKNEQRAKWERQRCRELEALLRLKLKLDPSSSASTSQSPPSSISSPPSSSFASKMTSVPRLVANMVFHRQQDAYKRAGCGRSSSSSSPTTSITTPSSHSSSPASSSSLSSSSDLEPPKGYNTFRSSRLRHTPSSLSKMVSADDMEMQGEEDEEGREQESVELIVGGSSSDL